MTPEYTPGPHDEYRGVIEIDCTEGLPDAVRATLQPTRFVRVGECSEVVEFDAANSTANLPPASAPNPHAGPDAPLPQS